MSHAGIDEWIKKLRVISTMRKRRTPWDPERYLVEEIYDIFLGRELLDSVALDGVETE